MRRADKLITFMCRLSWNLGAWTSWNPQGLSRPVMGLPFFFAIREIEGTHYGPGVGSASNRNEYQEYFLGDKDGRCVGLTTFMCRLSWNLGVSTSWSPQCLSRPVQGLSLSDRSLSSLLFIYCINFTYKKQTSICPTQHIFNTQNLETATVTDLN